MIYSYEGHPDILQAIGAPKNQERHKKNIMIVKRIISSFTKQKKSHYAFFVASMIALSLVSLTACKVGHNNFSKEKSIVSKSDSIDSTIRFKEPIHRDFDAIMASGVIRMITRFNSSSYFLHRGEEKGFEYELAREFARRHRLALEVVISPENEHPIDLLNSGRGDFIAANFSITPERLNYVEFSNPYNLVNQILVFRSGKQNPTSLAELNGITISVREGSSYLKTLKRIQEEKNYDFKIEVLPKIWDTEAILFALLDGQFEATVADDNLLRSASLYMNGLQEGPVISENDLIAWATRKNSPELTERMNQFLEPHFRISEVDSLPRRSSFMNVLKSRYFDNRPAIYNVRNYALGTGYEGIFSPFDNMVKPLAQEAGIDWKLVIAVMAQESRFDPYAESRMGALGLMQIIPRFSNVYYKDELFDPETNIREGLRFLRKHLNHYAYMDSTNQVAFALAAYNVGMGHMADARRLTIDRNRDPNSWEHVSESLLMLMNPHHYRNARHGYARGIETVNYVRNIMNRYQLYHTLMMFADEDPVRDRLDSILSSVDKR